MTLPSLAPAVGCSVRCNVSAKLPVPTHDDWASLYFEIERLYVRERRKLRYVMRYVEKVYGFKATQQMYKKRFAKWGIQKRSGRSATAASTARAMVSRGSSSSLDLDALRISPKTSNHDSLLLMFLTSVRIWSTSFYESLEFHDGAPASNQHSWPEQSEEINFTFKLVMDVLNRGYGSLAGRIARRAFLLVEDVLMLEGPALVWNVLEIMYHMVTSHQAELFEMLLAHLMALVEGRMSKTHPLPVMLGALRAVLLSLQGLKAAPVRSLPAPYSSCRLLDHGEETAQAGSWLYLGTLAPMIERAWTLNAEILFNHFDHRLFQLYFRIHWDSCSLTPPTAIIGAANQWLDPITPPKISNDTTETPYGEGFIATQTFEEDRMLQHLLTTPTDASLPPDYELLFVTSITVLRDHARSILSKDNGSIDDATVILRILAGLVTAKVLEQLPATTELSDATTGDASGVSRLQAGNVACAVKTSMDLCAKNRSDELTGPLNTVERIRSIVALRDYALAETDPRAIRDMWMLEDALIVAGEHEKASEARQKVHRRLEMLVQDIPVSTV